MRGSKVFNIQQPLWSFLARSIEHTSKQILAMTWISKQNYGKEAYLMPNHQE